MNSSNYITPFWVQNVTSSTINVTIKKNNASAPTVDVYYSNDLSTWTLLGQTSTITLSLNVAAGNKVYFRSNADQWAETSSTFYYNYFSSTGNCNIGGNIMSLLYGSNFTGYEKVFPNENCYGIFNGLFVGWKNLVDAGELVLPVTHMESRTGAMGNRCYRAMFNGCSNLINGPHVDLRFRDNPETDELYACMQRFIAGCPKLETIHINTQNLNGAFTDIFLSTNYNGLTWYDYSGNPRTVWPTNVTCVNVISMYIGYDRVVDWHSNYSGYVEQVDDNNSMTIYKKINEKNIPFNVTNITSSPITMSVRKISTNYSSGSYNGASDAPTITIEYSDDNLTSWKTWCTTSTTLQSLTIPAYTTYYFRASATRWAYHFSWGTSQIELTAFNNITFSGSSTVELAGNIMSLLYGSSFTGNETSFPNMSNTYVFSNLFGQESRSGETYTSIKSAKKLIMPVVTLNRACYSMMFYHNVNLIDSPNLPATTLAMACYSMMFRYCTSLMYASSLPATTLANECYWGMFYDCVSLTTAPELPATTIPYYTGELGNYVGAYDGMFTNCTSLNYVKCLATTNTEGIATHSWLDNVSSTGTFIKAANTNWVSGTSGIPSGWTVEEQ